MVGLRNPCKKCLVSSMCTKECEEYTKFNKLFKLFLSTENLGVILSLITLIPSSILILTGYFKAATVFMIMMLYFIIGLVLAYASKSVSKVNHEDHLFKWYNFIVLILIGLPISIAVIISNFLEKYRRCAAYK